MRKFDFRLSRFSWIPLFTGIVAVGLGIWCLCSPLTSVPVMAYLFAAILCGAGVFNLVFAIVNRRALPNWGWALALGILDLIAGVWLFTLPEAELAVTFVIVLGIWLLCISINAICETFVLSRSSTAWTVLSILLLFATIYFAIVILSSPAAMAVAGWLYLGFSLIAFGAFRIALYWRLNRLKKKSLLNNKC